MLSLSHDQLNSLAWHWQYVSLSHNNTDRQKQTHERPTKRLRLLTVPDSFWVPFPQNNIAENVDAPRILQKGAAMFAGKFTNSFK